MLITNEYEYTIFWRLSIAIVEWLTYITCLVMYLTNHIHICFFIGIIESIYLLSEYIKIHQWENSLGIYNSKNKLITKFDISHSMYEYLKFKRMIVIIDRWLWYILLFTIEKYFNEHKILKLIDNFIYSNFYTNLIETNMCYKYDTQLIKWIDKNISLSQTVVLLFGAIFNLIGYYYLRKMEKNIGIIPTKIINNLLLN